MYDDRLRELADPSPLRTDRGGSLPLREPPYAHHDRASLATVAPPSPSGTPAIELTARGRVRRANVASRSLVDIFANSVARWPTRDALVDARGRLTYAQLAVQSQRLSDRLGDLGIGRGDRVGVRVASGTTDLYVAILGTLLSGAAYVPVDAGDPDERAETVWREARVAAIVGDRLEVAQRCAGSGAAGNVRPDDDCWVIFTSGSTGTPKGVAVRHRSAAAFVDAEAALWQVSPDDRVFGGLSVGFDASCEEMWLAWRNGAALVACPRSVVQSGVDLGPFLVEHKITVVSSVPTLAAMWDDEVLAGVRLVILGGEACPNELGWRLAAGREVWNTYGPTEATVVSTATRIWPDRPVTIGSPLAGWGVAVLDERGEPVSPGESGELVLTGIGLARYLDADADRRAFAPVPALGPGRAYRTGDLVRDGANGLEFLGRRDDQVKLGGRRLELAEIDAQLAAVPGVRAAAAALRTTASGNTVLVGYVAGDVEPAAVRAALALRLPEGIVPIIVVLDDFVRKSSGKVDRKTLPWPPPTRPDADRASALSATESWLATRWIEQLGPFPVTADSDFFELGGTSLAVARLVSALRDRYPTTAVADVYLYRRLGELATRLEHLEQRAPEPDAPEGHARRFAVARLAGVVALLGFTATQLAVGVLGYDQWRATGPRIGWAGVVLAWLALSSAPGRALLVALARRTLLADLRPGRYPREGWLATRLWFVERLAEALHLEALAGTPWTVRYARLNGARVARGARLATLPSPTSLVEIGKGATVEDDVDVRGWWIEGPELVVGTVTIEQDARVGTRCFLLPGAVVGRGAEVEPGSVVTGTVPAGERWSGSPATRVGLAGETWPVASRDLDEGATNQASRARFVLGLGVIGVLPLVAALPSVALLGALGSFASLHATVVTMLLASPGLAALYLATYAALVALAVRSVSFLIQPGDHADTSATAWALWFSEAVMARARGVLFPLYSSVYTRSWLRLLGVKVGRRTEVSTAVGLNRLVEIGSSSFLADDVVFAGARARGGRIEVAPPSVGSRTFLGNGAILRAGTRLGDDALVGVQSSPPLESADGTSWFGLPALELPRVVEWTDPARTTSPPRRLVVARGLIEIVRIVLPTSVSVALGALVFLALEAIGAAEGVLALLVAAPFVVAAAALAATAFTVVAKWALMGHYRAEQHPLWSFYVWRDELVNTFQEQLAGAWLLMSALGTPVMGAYLRAMGAKVGRRVWFETLAVTEFDLVTLGDGCSVNRGACVETHLFHDRLMRLGPAVLGPHSTLGPNSAVLPDTALGAHCSVGPRSVVLRGEHLPPSTRWLGVPVKCA